MKLPRSTSMRAGCVAGFFSFAVYAFTAAPNVTLLDGGELIVAAQHFGVPHPPGYPLWTILAWIFQLLPLGNAAWEIALFSGVCGALAVGCAAWLISESIRWLARAHPAAERVGGVVAVAFSLAWAFTIPLWSQAVIAEVYALHSLVVMLYLIALFRWMRAPSRTRGLVAVALWFALGMSNHHLMLSLAGLPLLAVLLLRADLMAEFVVFLALIGAGVYLGFAWLSGDPATWSTAVRFGLCAIVALLALGWVRRRVVHWRLGLLLAGAVVLGLAPYAYMPLASATNPPMNWGYARNPDGFFYSINRSQYHGTLSDQLLKVLGTPMGSRPPEVGWRRREPERGRIAYLADFAGFYWITLARSFSLVPVLGFLAAVWAIFITREKRRLAWLLLLFIGFFLAAFLEPFFNQPGTDVMAWLVEMPYHGYAYGLCAVLSGIGFALAFLRIRRRWDFSANWIALLLLLPGYGLWHNRADSTQRGRWWGWEFGHEMLAGLPQGSIVLGGTDPGRFVPTYMIFGESPQSARVKRDPGFDRRDLYIITQNTLTDPFYLQYLRDQYTAERPQSYNWFERLLGRPSMYPEADIVLPTDAEVRALFEKLSKEHEAAGPEAPPPDFNSAMARWLFEHNKKEHAFYVEESFPMAWSYPHAVPHGLGYRIAPERLEELAPEVVEADRVFWKNYVEKLLGDPRFREDVDGRHAFSKLRTTTGNIYRSRAMLAEAELAYRQALELWPANTEVLRLLVDLLIGQRRFTDAQELMERAYPLDPDNPMMKRLTAAAFMRKNLQGEIEAAEANRGSAPEAVEAILALLRNYEAAHDTEAAEKLIASVLAAHPADPILFQEIVNHHVRARRFDRALAVARQWDAAMPDEAEVKFVLARFLFATGAREEFYKRAQEAVTLGGLAMRQRFARDELFVPIRREPEFQGLATPP